MAGITPRRDAQLGLLRYAHEIDLRATEEEQIPGYPKDGTEHLKDVAYYMRMAAAYVETLPDIYEADGDEPGLPEQSETSA